MEKGIQMIKDAIEPMFYMLMMIVLLPVVAVITMIDAITPKSKKCPYCGNILDKENPICSVCGAELNHKQKQVAENRNGCIVDSRRHDQK